MLMMNSRPRKRLRSPQRDFHTLAYGKADKYGLFHLELAKSVPCWPAYATLLDVNFCRVPALRGQEEEEEEEEGGGETPDRPDEGEEGSGGEEEGSGEEGEEEGGGEEEGEAEPEPLTEMFGPNPRMSYTWTVKKNDGNILVEEYTIEEATWWGRNAWQYVILEMVNKEFIKHWVETRLPHYEENITLPQWRITREKATDVLAEEISQVYDEIDDQHDERVKEIRDAIAVDKATIESTSPWDWDDIKDEIDPDVSAAHQWGIDEKASREQEIREEYGGFSAIIKMEQKVNRKVQERIDKIEQERILAAELELADERERRLNELINNLPKRLSLAEEVFLTVDDNFHSWTLWPVKTNVPKVWMYPMDFGVDDDDDDDDQTLYFEGERNLEIGGEIGGGMGGSGGGVVQQKTINLMIRGVRPAHYPGRNVREYVSTTTADGLGGVFKRRPDTLPHLMLDDSGTGSRSHVDFWVEDMYNNRVLFDPTGTLFADLTWRLYPRDEVVDNDPIVGTYVVHLNGAEGMWNLGDTIDFGGVTRRGEGHFMIGYQVAFVSLSMSCESVDLDKERYLSHVRVDTPGLLADTSDTLHAAPWKLREKMEDVDVFWNQVDIDIKK
jgi:hypothetical protein